MTLIDDKTTAKALIALMLQDAKASLEEQLLSQLEDIISTAMMDGLSETPYELEITVSTPVPSEHVELMVAQVPDPMDEYLDAAVKRGVSASVVD
ncbi:MULTISPECIES: hypothetical protein [Rhodopirellula]|uniref:hypothetical protein n=1 Tax=Rhodopirellula TaxID=265488 RepID=UPI002579854C|nr:hypothetical protein [Rhodopirellula sp. UBA1907]|tara:strand:- start:93 stop:377 length:285 start_codon:yes stop_codon:yes gene_type:complete